MIWLKGEKERLYEITCTEDKLDGLIEHFGTAISLTRDNNGNIAAMCRTTESRVREWENLSAVSVI